MRDTLVNVPVEDMIRSYRLAVTIAVIALVLLPSAIRSGNQVAVGSIFLVFATLAVGTVTKSRRG